MTIEEAIGLYDFFSKFGINLTNHVERENFKRVYGGHERRTE